jgi:hypothetical protein
MRQLPWFQEAVRRNDTGASNLTDCDRCMQTTTQLRRQLIRCGYEPPLTRIRLPEPLRPWSHSADPHASTYTTCPGYTTKLPEVVEASHAHAHWNKHDIRIATGGDEPNRALVMAVEVVAGAANATQEWLMTPASKGGGAAG